MCLPTYNRVKSRHPNFPGGIFAARVIFYNNISLKPPTPTILGRVVRGTLGLSESLAPLQLNDFNLPSFEAFYQGCTQQLEKGTEDILVHITDIFADEVPETGAFGTVDVRVEIYAVKNNLYYPIYTLDQYEVVTAFEATKKTDTYHDHRAEKYS